MKRLSAALLALLLAPLAAFAASQDYQPRLNYDLAATINIALSSTTSGAVDLHGTQLVGLFVPSGFTGTQLTFAIASTPGGVYIPVDIDNTSANPYIVTTAGGKYAPITNPDVFRGARYIEVLSSSNQTSSVILNLATRPMQ